MPQEHVSTEDYARAEAFLPWNVSKLVSRFSVDPQWLDGGRRFWYRVATDAGAEFVLVDPAAGTRRPAFDHVALAAALTRASGNAISPTKLPFETIDVDSDDVVAFRAFDRGWRFDAETLHEDDSVPAQDKAVLTSPDRRFAAFLREHNIWLREYESGDERQLTHDGAWLNGYGELPEDRTTTVTDRLRDEPMPPSGVWSPDSRWLFTYRMDQRQVPEMFLLQGHPGRPGARAVAHSYRVPLAEDNERAQAHLVCIDVESGQLTIVDAAPLEIMPMTPGERSYIGWSGSSQQAWFIRRERGSLVAGFYRVDPATGQVRQILEERGETLTAPHLSPTTDRPMVWLSGDGRQALWHSQRDGWGHLYRYDTDGGEPVQLTQGPWVVRELVRVDEDTRQVYFTAGGREPGQFPYQRLLYRISLDGGEPTLLSPEDADHQIIVPPEGDYLLDTYSTVAQPPSTVVRNLYGEITIELEQADISRLLALGWRPPELHTLKGRDGRTDIHAAVVRPTNFDPERSYPVLDSIYPGPQRGVVPLGFPDPNTSAIGGFWAAQSLAELGFIVVLIDGQGMPFRERAFHEFAYRNFQDGGGLPDHIAALRQLARLDSALDLERVGIYGHSGGGYASVKALLQHPDFYKVAVSSAGNHDQRGYGADWGELYLGLPETNPGAWEAQSNLHLVDRLQGKLLLVWGEMDDNVHPALTVQLIDGFIKAGKEIDMLMLPNCNHSFIDLLHTPQDRRGNNPNNHFFIRKRWDYFVRHLAGKEPPTGYVIGRDLG